MSLRRVTVLTLAVVLAAAPAGAAEITKHSGTISRVDPAHETLVLKQMGPWTGPGTGAFTRRITLAPGTKVDLVQRSRKPVAGGWPGGYVKSPLSVDRLHPGEFATVTVERRGNKSVALAIDVVRPRES